MPGLCEYNFIQSKKRGSVRAVRLLWFIWMGHWYPAFDTREQGRRSLLDALWTVKVI